MFEGGLEDAGRGKPVREGFDSRGNQDTRRCRNSRSPEAGLCSGLVVGKRTGPRIGADDGDPVRLEKGSHEGPEAAAPPVGVRVVDHKIASAVEFSYVELYFLRIHQEVLMTEGGKPPG
jgi:hypothetical protein